MKTCTKCKINKDLSEYYKSKSKKDGLQYVCKMCNNYQHIEYLKTKDGVIARIFGAQRSNSKRRGHNLPTYTKKELSNWLLNDWLFNLLYNNWVNCGYFKNTTPSVDRIDDSKGYSFDNVQLMTWGENRAKQSVDMRNGKLNTIVPHKAVLQFTKNGKFIKEYVSASEASRQIGSKSSHISECCNSKLKSSNGYVWKFA